MGGHDPNDTMRMDDFQDEMLLGGFGGGSNGGDFFNLMGELDNAPVGGTDGGSGVLEKHSQLHDQFNNYHQQSKYPMATEIAFELGSVLYDGYCSEASGALPTFTDEEVALLLAKYEKQLGATKLLEQLSAFSTGFKSSSAAQSLNAAGKDKATVEKSLKDALGAFNDQHSAYLSAKSAFDKKGPEKTKASELKRFAALVDLNLQLIRLIKKL